MAYDEVQRVLERLVNNEDFRHSIRETPDHLTSGFDLTPGEAGLLTALTEAAYGLDDNLVAAFQHRMCAVAGDE